MITQWLIQSTKKGDFLRSGKEVVLKNNIFLAKIFAKQTAFVAKNKEEKEKLKGVENDT